MADANAATGDDFTVTVRRVAASDVAGADTRYRYQTAFVYQNYAALHARWLGDKEAHNALERRYLAELGFGFIARHFSDVKPCRAFELTPENV